MLREVAKNVAAGVPEWPIPRSTWNDVFTLAQEAGLNPEDFERKLVYSQGTPMYSVWAIIHRPTGSYYVFDGKFIPAARTDTTTQLIDVMHPGRHLSVQSEKVTIAGQVLKDWMRLVKNEASQPDLWQTAQVGQGVMKAAAAESNQPFSPTEQESIAKRLTEIEQHLKSLAELGPVQQTYVENQFKYLADAAKRTGRKDWLNLAIGVIISLIIEIAPTKEVGQSFFRFAMAQLAAIYHAAQDLLQYLPPAAGV
jgi:hypothetical protein